MSGSASFRLAPLLHVRRIRLRTVETELRECRRIQLDAEARRAAAEQSLEEATRAAASFRLEGLQKLLVSGADSGTGMLRYKRRLAWLGAHTENCARTLEAAEADLASAIRATEEVLVRWREARRKTDALEELAARWRKQERARKEMQQEDALEELALRKQAVS